MTGSAPSSNDRPLKASPEVIATPPKETASDAAQKLDAPSTSSTGGTTEPTANATFSSTNQHVAGRKGADAPTERFTNTKLNIALINDPKNGPRFTLTKKEAGLVEESGAGNAKGTEDRAKETRHQRVAEETAPSSATQISPTAQPESAAAIGMMGVGTQKRKPATDVLPPASSPFGTFSVPPAAEPPSKVPVDSSKTFVGPNGTYYDEAWRWMDWRGTKRSWNWPAALTFGHWFAYRRLYGHATLYAAWLMALTGALVNNIHVGVVTGILALTLTLTGFYANILYFRVFRRSVAHVTEKGKGTYDELKTQLAEAGGVNPKAPGLMAGMTIAGLALVLFVTFSWRGGFLINIWPF